MVKVLKNGAGFSLIELMVVVVVIGILASIAVPSYNNYLNKSRELEAKIVLSEIYAAEMSFFSEWESYSTDLKAIGVAETRLKHYDIIGFSGATGATAVGVNVPFGFTADYYPGPIEAGGKELHKVLLKSLSGFGIERPSHYDCGLNEIVFRACAQKDKQSYNSETDFNIDHTQNLKH